MESMSILHDRLDERDIQNFNYSSEPKKILIKIKEKENLGNLF